MNEFGVTDAKAKELAERMRAINLLESDIEETFIKGGGRGGQKINKSNSCVQLKHLPSGVVVRCGQERSRALNRFFARRALCQRLEMQNPEMKSAASDEALRIRRNKERTARRHRKKHSE